MNVFDREYICKSLFKQSSYSHLFVLTQLRDNDLCSIKNKPTFKQLTQKNLIPKRVEECMKSPNCMKTFFYFDQNTQYYLPFYLNLYYYYWTKHQKQNIVSSPFQFTPIAINYLTSFFFSMLKAIFLFYNTLCRIIH